MTTAASLTGALAEPPTNPSPQTASDLPAWRQALAVGGLLCVIGALAAGATPFDAAQHIQLTLVVGLAGFAIYSAYAFAQAAARGIGWLALFTGSLGASATLSPEDVLQVLGAATFLIALGGVGVRPDGRFGPTHHRRTLVVMMSLGAAVAIALSMVAVIHRSPGLEIAAALTLSGGVLGLGRMKTWGLLAYLAGALLVLGDGAHEALQTYFEGGSSLHTWYRSGIRLALGSALLLPAVALLFRRRVPSDRRYGVGAAIHAAAVAGVSVSALLAGALRLST